MGDFLGASIPLSATASVSSTSLPEYRRARSAKLLIPGNQAMGISFLSFLRVALMGGVPGISIYRTGPDSRYPPHNIQRPPE
jgi:hypothetical protein